MVRNEVAVAAAHRLRICVRRGWDGSFVRDRVDLRKLPTLDVAGSIPVARSLPKPPADGGFVASGLLRHANVTEGPACRAAVILVILAAMKTAVSLPDDLFKAVDAYAKRHRLSRSGVLATAARRFLANEAAPESATDAWNRAIDAAGQPSRDAASIAFRRRTASIVRKSRSR